MESYDGHHRAVSILLQANANPNLQKKNSVTPLFMAAHEWTALIQSVILLQANANPNLQKKNSVTPLFMAAQNGHSNDSQYSSTSECQSQMLPRDDGVTPLYMAALDGHSDRISTLLKANANPNLQADDGAYTSVYSSPEWKTLMQSVFFYKQMPIPIFKTDDCVTPLYIAAQNGHSDSVSILLQANANPNLQADDGVTPLCIAAANGHSDTVSILLQMNANPNLQADDGVTPLCIAAENGHSGAVSILLQDDMPIPIIPQKEMESHLCT